MAQFCYHEKSFVFLFLSLLSFFLSLFSFLFFFLSLFFLSFIHSFIHSFLFCPDRENSPYIDKYSLLTERVEATITVGGYTARKTGYQWCGGYCGMDLAIDEQGLWVLWGSTGNSGKLYASSIDVYQNVITQTWTLHTGKHMLYSLKSCVLSTKALDL